MTFKDCVMEDIERVFFDLTEFGEEHLVDGKKAVVVLEDDDTREHNSHWEAGAKQNFDTGLYSAQMILYIKKAMAPSPRWASCWSWTAELASRGPLQSRNARRRAACTA